MSRSSTATRKKRAYHHGDLRRALLEKAERVLESEGLEGVTLRRIAKGLGVSHAAPAHHFQSRGALLSALAGRGYDALAAQMQAASERAGAAGALGAIGEAYVRFALARPQLFRLMFSLSAGADPEAEEAAARCQALLRSAAEEACGPVAGSTPTAQDSALPVRALVSWAQVHGLAMLWLDGQLAEFFPGPGGEARYLAQVRRLLAPTTSAGG